MEQIIFKKNEFNKWAFNDIELEQLNPKELEIVSLLFIYLKEKNN